MSFENAMKRNYIKITTSYHTRRKGCVPVTVKEKIILYQYTRLIAVCNKNK